MQLHRNRLLVVVAVGAAVLIAIVTLLQWQARSLRPEQGGSGSDLEASNPVRLGARTDEDFASPELLDPSESAPPIEEKGIGYVQFPSGNSVRVTFAAAPRLVTTSDLPANIASEYDQLVSKVKSGDEYTAFLLHHSLQVCADFPIRTEEELGDAIDQALQTRTITVGPEGDQVETRANLRVEENMRWTFGFCNGLSDEQRSEGPAWLREAADMGHPLAMKYVVGTDLGNSAEGRAYLLSAFDKGFYDTIGTLGLYLVGSERLPYRTTEGEQQFHDYSDKTLGYAYYYLYLKLVEADNKFPTSSIEDFYRYKEEMIDPYVSQSQREDGIELAEQLLLENEDCCLTLRDGDSPN